MSNHENPTRAVNYQVGVHSVDTSPVDFAGGNDDSDFIEFQLEHQAVFKRLADDIYESDEAGIREALTNAVTAVLKAIRNHGVDDDEGVIEFTLDQRGGRDTLILRDNGVGMTEEELREVVAVVGRSTTRDLGEMAGQFGMGFLALFKLVGMNGGFFMHTHARNSDDGPISGVWKSGGFARDTEGELEGRFADDEYGTQFELILKEDISASAIKNWVKRNATWARLPVMYQEVDPDGTPGFNDDYGGDSFDDHYPDDAHVLKLDTPYFEARCTNEPLEETILLDVPIDRNHKKVKNAPWPKGVDIRLKNENGVVVAGPNEGLMPVTEGEYAGMDEARREKYIPESHLRDADVVMPGPIGTRGTLDENKEFWQWLGDRFMAEYSARVRALVDRVETSDDSIWALDKDEFKFLVDAIPTKASRLSTTKQSNISETFADDYGIDLSDDTAQLLYALVRSVDIAPRNARGSIKKKENLNENQTISTWLHDVKRDDRDGEVYIGQCLSKKKARVVWEDNPYSVVAHVDTNHYDFYTEVLNWNLLKTVTKQRVRDGEFDISDSTRERFLDTNKSRPTRSSDKGTGDLVLHFGSSRRSKKRTTVKGLVRECEKRAGQDRDGGPLIHGKRADTLVAFPASCDRQISNHYWLNDTAGTAVFKCTDSQWARLDGTPYVAHVDDHIETARNTPFLTNEGERTMTEVGDRVVFHVFDNKRRADKFCTLDMARRTKRVLEDEPWRENVYNYASPPEDFVYAPIRASDLADIYPAIRGATVLEATRHAWNKSEQTTHRAPSPSTLYMHARTEELRGTPELTALESKWELNSMHDGSKDKVIIDLLERVATSDLTLPSEDD